MPDAGFKEDSHMISLNRRRAWIAAAPLLAVALAFAGCQQNAGTEADNPPAKASAGGAELISFTSDFDAAIATAGEQDKIVMLDVYTDWCTWCHKLDEEVYSDAAVAAEVNKDFVALKVNPEKGQANKDFVEKYTVRGFPTILFLNGKGEEIHRLVGFKPADGFLEELETARDKAGSST